MNWSTKRLFSKGHVCNRQDRDLNQFRLLINAENHPTSAKPLQPEWFTPLLYELQCRKESIIFSEARSNRQSIGPSVAPPGVSWQSGEIFDWLARAGRCCRHLMGRCRGCRCTSYNIQGAPTIKSCPEQNVNNDNQLSPPRTKIFPPFLFSTTAFKSIDSLHPKLLRPTFLKLASCTFPTSPPPCTPPPPKTELCSLISTLVLSSFYFI